MNDAYSTLLQSYNRRKCRSSQKMKEGRQGKGGVGTRWGKNGKAHGLKEIRNPAEFMHNNFQRKNIINTFIAINFINKKTILPHYFFKQTLFHLHSNNANHIKGSRSMLVNVQPSIAAVVVRVHCSPIVVVQCEVFVESGLLGTSHYPRGEVRVAVCQGEDERLHLVKAALAFSTLLALFVVAGGFVGWGVDGHRDVFCLDYYGFCPLGVVLLLDGSIGDSIGIDSQLRRSNILSTLQLQLLGRIPGVNVLVANIVISHYLWLSFALHRHSFLHRVIAPFLVLQLQMVVLLLQFAVLHIILKHLFHVQLALLKRMTRYYLCFLGRDVAHLHFLCLEDVFFRRGGDKGVVEGLFIRGHVLA